MKKSPAAFAFALCACAPTHLDGSYAVRDADTAISIAKASRKPCWLSGETDHWEASFKDGTWEVRKYFSAHDGCNWEAETIDARTGKELPNCSVCVVAD
jgi:hypothetical protein